LGAYAEGIDEQGQPIDVVDRQRERVMALAARQGEIRWRSSPTASCSAT